MCTGIYTQEWDEKALGTCSLNENWSLLLLYEQLFPLSVIWLLRALLHLIFS